MLFNSLKFLIFFPVAALLYYLVPPRWRYIWLLIISYFFYGCFAWRYIFIMLGVTVITFAAGLLIERARGGSVEEEDASYAAPVPEPAIAADGSRHSAHSSHAARAARAARTAPHKHSSGFVWMLTALLLCLGILFFFKYTNFFIGDVLTGISAVFPELGLGSVSFSIALPVGISFFIFQSLSYVFEVYKGKYPAEHNFLYYAAFVSFFPLICSGPIERGPHLLPQMHEIHKLDLHKIKRGLLLMLWGYFQKLVISDRAAILVTQVFNNYHAYEGFQLVTAAVFFGIQIYGDFAGYSNLAIGVANVLGFDIKLNFDTPYLSRSVGEFWRRWHISLSSWFRDYIYFPLGGGRCSRGRKYLNVMIVFLVSGLWHGAGWTFIIWGGLNGLFQVLEQQFAPQRAWMCEKLHINTESLAHKVVQTIITFCLVDFAWIFFNAADIQTALGFIWRMFTTLNISNLFGGALFELGLSSIEMHIFVAAMVLQIIVSLFNYNGITVRDVLCKQGLLWQDIIIITGVFIVLIFGIYGPAYNASSFIYMQF